MGSIIITSPNTGYGKTAVTCAIAGIFNNPDREILISKIGSDGQNDLSLNQMNELRANSDTIANTRVVESKELLQNAKNHQIIKIIEAASTDPNANLKLADQLDANILIVNAENSDLNDLANLYGSRLGGVILNKTPKYKRTIYERSLPSNAKLLGNLPEERALVASNLATIVEYLNAQYVIGEEHDQRLIRDFLIGGLVLDWGPTYFNTRQDAAVVVRGDRPDVQIAALQSESIKALVLTRGIQPIEYVYYEARQRQIPIIVTKDNTADVANHLGAMPINDQFDHPTKLNSMINLLNSHIDLDPLTELLLQPATQ